MRNALTKSGIATAGLIIIGGLSLSGCATEDYVNKQVAVVSQRVDALEARVGQVDHGLRLRIRLRKPPAPQRSRPTSASIS